METSILPVLLDEFKTYMASQTNLPEDITDFVYDYIDNYLQHMPVRKMKDIIKEYGWNTTAYLCHRKKIFLNFEDEMEITVYVMSREVLYDYFVEHI